MSRCSWIRPGCRLERGERTMTTALTAYLRGYMEKRAGDDDWWMDAKPDRLTTDYDQVREEKLRLARVAASGSKDPRLLEEHRTRNLIYPAPRSVPNRYGQAVSLGEIPSIAAPTSVPHQDRQNALGVDEYNLGRMWGSPREVFQGMQERSFNTQTIEFIKKLIRDGKIQANRGGEPSSVGRTA
jgi:hypothetical protein